MRALVDMFPGIGAITPFAEVNGRRNYGIDWEGQGSEHVRVLVEQQPDDAAAREIARAPAHLRVQDEYIADLERQLRDLRAKLPPARGTRLFGEGCVREAPGPEKGIWLLSDRAKGWASFGMLLDGWDDLFRRYDVRVTSAGTDETGPYWIVVNREVES